ncbi:MAG: hypothetical protein ACRDT5_20115, partial [Mycobacterium sp.]
WLSRRTSDLEAVVHRRRSPSRDIGILLGGEYHRHCFFKTLTFCRSESSPMSNIAAELVTRYEENASVRR